MQVHPGVFVSRTSTEESRSDPEIRGGAEEHVLVDAGAMRAGLSRFGSDADPHPHQGVLPQTEILLVLDADTVRPESADIHWQSGRDGRR